MFKINTGCIPADLSPGSLEEAFEVLDRPKIFIVITLLRDSWIMFDILKFNVFYNRGV